MTGTQALARLRAKVAAAAPIIGAGAGTGLSAKCAEAGGADLIIIYNSGRYRMAGRGSLAGMMPYGDANAIVIEMASEVLPVVERTPVLAGVCGTDPFRLMDRFLAQIERGRVRRRAELPDGRPDRRHLPRQSRGDRDGLRARGRDDPPRGRARPADRPVRLRRRGGRGDGRAGADVLVAHMGLTTKGTIGARTARTLDECVARSRRSRRAPPIDPDVIVLCHGGPIAEPDDAAYVLERPRASSGSSARRAWSGCRPRSR